MAGVGRLAYFCKKATTAAISCWIPPSSLKVSSMIFSSLGRNSCIMARRGKWKTRQRPDKICLLFSDLSTESRYSLYLDLNSCRSVTDSSSLTLTWNTLWTWQDSCVFFDSFIPRIHRNKRALLPLLWSIRASLFERPSMEPDCFPSIRISGGVLQISSIEDILSASLLAKSLSSSEERWESTSVVRHGYELCRSQRTRRAMVVAPVPGECRISTVMGRNRPWSKSRWTWTWISLSSCLLASWLS